MQFDVVAWIPILVAFFAARVGPATPVGQCAPYNKFG